MKREIKREDRLRVEEEDRKQSKVKQDKKRDRHAEKDRKYGKNETYKRKYEERWVFIIILRDTLVVVWI